MVCLIPIEVSREIQALRFIGKIPKAARSAWPLTRYDRVADNIAAIAATLDAMRAIERHGGAEILERTFLGFAQLPAQRGRSWREVLGFTGPLQPSNADAIEQRYRELARVRHPDTTSGSHAQMSELNAARDQAITELSQH